MRQSALGRDGEFDIIRRIIAARTSAGDPHNVLAGPGDDCAVVRGGPFALSVDLSIEGVHFRREWITPRDIGYRSAMAALSDLAAAAARPVGVLTAIAAPADAAQQLDDIAAGVDEAVTTCGGAVLGGDVTRSTGPIVVDVVAIGETPAPVTRRGAVPGDVVWVTGELGGAAAAVAAWLAGETPRDDAVARFARPSARTAQASWLAERGLIRAAVDLSDGIAGDAAHLAAASECAVVLQLHKLPLHEAALAYGEERALELALGGGDDYELCFVAPAGAAGVHIEAFERTFGVRLTRIGFIEEGSGVYAIGRDGTRTPLAPAGFDHFRGEGNVIPGTTS